jgi:DNA topoisomerase IB
LFVKRLAVTVGFPPFDFFAILEKERTRGKVMAKKKPEFDKKKAKETIEKGKRKNWWERKGSKSRGFRYVDKNGEKVTDEKHIERIKSLVIPPAWKYVRISPFSRSSLQAIGMDTTGRVQYLYSERYRAKQEAKKFKKIEQFGEHLPNLRKITNQHLELKGLPREKVLAVMTRLINSLYIRMGSIKSVKNYRTYGITTLQHRHLDIKPIWKYRNVLYLDFDLRLPLRYLIFLMCFTRS